MTVHAANDGTSDFTSMTCDVVDVIRTTMSAQQASSAEIVNLVFIESTGLNCDTVEGATDGVVQVGDSPLQAEGDDFPVGGMVGIALGGALVLLVAVLFVRRRRPSSMDEDESAVPVDELSVDDKSDLASIAAAQSPEADDSALVSVGGNESTSDQSGSQFLPSLEASNRALDATDDLLADTGDFVGTTPTTTKQAARGRPSTKNSTTTLSTGLFGALSLLWRKQNTLPPKMNNVPKERQGGTPATVDTDSGGSQSGSNYSGESNHDCSSSSSGSSTDGSSGDLREVKRKLFNAGYSPLHKRSFRSKRRWNFAFFWQSSAAKNFQQQPVEDGYSSDSSTDNAVLLCGDDTTTARTPEQEERVPLTLSSPTRTTPPSSSQGCAQGPDCECEECIERNKKKAMRLKKKRKPRALVKMDSIPETTEVENASFCLSLPSRSPPSSVGSREASPSRSLVEV